MSSGSDAPDFDGRCAFALSLGPADKAPQGKSDCTLEHEGHTYVFSGAVPLFLFSVLPGSAARAQRHWAERSAA